MPRSATAIGCLFAAFLTACTGRLARRPGFPDQRRATRARNGRGPARPAAARPALQQPVRRPGSPEHLRVDLTWRRVWERALDCGD